MTTTMTTAVVDWVAPLRNSLMSDTQLDDRDASVTSIDDDLPPYVIIIARLFYSAVFFYKCWPIYIICGTQCTEVICNITIIDMWCPLYLHMVTTLPWEIFMFGFWDHFGWFIPLTTLIKWLRNMTVKFDHWKIIAVANYHDVGLNTGARDALYTCAITVTLTFHSKAVCQHADVCIRQSSYHSVKLRSLLVQAYDLQLGLCWWKRRLL